MTSSRTPISLSLACSRRLAVWAQGLAQRPDRGDKTTLLNVIRKLGLLQLDTIHVVARSHYLVMLSRAGLYNVSDLDALLYPDRQLFEQWAHAACLIPIEDYAYFAPLIAARRQHPGDRRALLGDSPEEILAEVQGRIAAEGPLRSVDFRDPRAQRGTWWDWKPAKIALEILFEEGYLMIDRRVNFQRYYDLAERVLPVGAGLAHLTIEDFRRWATLRSIECLGVATVGQIADYYRQPKIALRPVVEALLVKGAIVPAEVEGWREPAFVAAGQLTLIDEIDAGAYSPGVTAFLSPFDNLIWDRRRVRDLFNFDYRIEVYTPLATKARRYGYYVLPILHNGRLIGRLDPKADRQSGTLIVHAFYLEPDVVTTGELLAALRRALWEFAEFHGCESVHITRTEPAELGALLMHDP